MCIRMNFLLFNLISYLGIISIFTAYSLNRVIKLNQKIYNILNMIGGLLLAVYAIHTANMIFTILNTVWSVIALIDLINIYRKEV